MAQFRQEAAGLWTASDDLYIGPRFNLGCRMTIVRLQDGGILLHSPIRGDRELFKAIDSLGPVTFVVAPNNYHHRFAKETLDRYPKAKFYGVASLPAKRPDLPKDHLIRPEFQSPWRELQAFVVARPLLQEAVFLHHSSRTLILTDLAFNLQRAENWWNAMGQRLFGVHRHFAPSRTAKLFLGKGPPIREKLRTIAASDFDRIIVAHGDVIPSQGQLRFREAFASYM